MELLIAAQDIASISLGLVEDGCVVRERTVATNPEGYLGALHETLQQWNSAPDQIDGIFVVTGSGSFTASRVSTTISNALAFAKDVPILALENPNHLSLKDLDLSAAKTVGGYVKPKYDRPPEITVSKKARGDNADD